MTGSVKRSDVGIRLTVAYHRADILGNPALDAAV